MTPEELLIQFLPELIVGLVLSALVWSFKTWSLSMTVQIDKILTRVDRLTQEFHDYRVENEGRLTRAETDLKNIYRRLDHDDIQRAVKSHLKVTG